MSVSPLLAGLLAGVAALLLRAMALALARRDRERLGSAGALRRFAPTPRRGRHAAKSLLLAVGVGLVAAVAAGAGAREVVHEERPGPETVIVLDASNSMLAEDVEPSRLERQRELAGRLAERLPGKVGVVYFAGRGYVLAPLTVDASAVRMLVDAVRPASVGRGGTALAAGISEALSVLDGGQEGVGAVVLFSDGEETVGGVLDEAIARAARTGVPVHTVGIGTADGGQIPLGPDVAGDPLSRLEGGRGFMPRGLEDGRPGGRGAGERRGYLRGPDGEIVVTRLHDETLRLIAEGTAGSYWAADEAAIDALAQRLAAGREEPASGPGGPSAGWLLFAAFVLLWLEAFGIAGARPAAGGGRRKDDGPTREGAATAGNGSRRGRATRVGATRRPPDGSASGRPAARGARVAGLVLPLALAAAAAAPAPYAAAEGGRVAVSGVPQAAPGAPPTLQESPRVARYREEVDRSGRPLDWYNLGTALLRDGRWEEADEPLRRAAGADAERIRAYGEYNRGLAAAEGGRSEERPPEARRQNLLEAREAFREVLRQEPAHDDARWNLELVERWLQNPPLAGAGGGAGGEGGGDDDDSGGGDLDHGAAEALLDEAARAEAELRGRVLERTRLRDPVVERNW